MSAVDFPQVQSQARSLCARFSDVHRNARRSNEVFLQRDINIFVRYLQTDNEVGYAVLDADLNGHASPRNS
jgi:hypothetical protein